MKIGYTKELEKLVRACGKYYASCRGCRYYDETDSCTNSMVTSFDLREKDGRQFCIFWEPEKGEKQ